MKPTNFLIGRAELLTGEIKAPRRSLDKTELYTFAESIGRLRPQINNVVADMEKLPKAVCPDGCSVARVIMNPSYIARSFFPQNFFREIGLESVGSRTTHIRPQKWKRKGAVEEVPTTEIFVAGEIGSFERIIPWIDNAEAGSLSAKDFSHIESFCSFSAQDRIVSLEDSKKQNYYEVVLHSSSFPGENSLRSAFINYANENHIEVYDDLGFRSGTLLFLPIKGSPDKVKKLALFSFVRIIRPMPTLRGLRPLQRSLGVPSTSFQLPTEAAVSPDTRVAILDGGLPEHHPIGPWVKTYRKLDQNADDYPDGPSHGIAVTSAFLFGPMEAGGEAKRPFAPVDHLRVLDDESRKEQPLELYRTLGLIEEVLLSRQYQFINLSIGPYLPIEDTDVHAWTAVIDDLLSDGETFVTIAAGNNGEGDSASGNDRIQVPSDCVNAVAVGATNHSQKGWQRASYSAKGPGRSPGLIKPDLVTFGGEMPTYFHVLGPTRRPTIAPQQGTSFAAPYLLRHAVGIRAILGNNLTPLAIKALLIHSARLENHDPKDVGWGKVPDDLMSIITCEPGVARLVYKGELKAGKYLRAPLPIPEGGLKGMITLSATFCFASQVDPQDSAAYTKSGLDITFRPNSSKIDDGKDNAKTRSFFTKKKYATEAELRSDHGKWETVLHDSTRMRASSLDNPAFDIHYNARDCGGAGSRNGKIPYALIITIECQKNPDIFNEILRSYQQILSPIEPTVSIPVRSI